MVSLDIVVMDCFNLFCALENESMKVSVLKRAEAETLSARTIRNKSFSSCYFCLIAFRLSFFKCTEKVKKIHNNDIMGRYWITFGPFTPKHVTWLPTVIQFFLWVIVIIKQAGIPPTIVTSVCHIISRI